jgi:tol-pal system protein YbgF
MKRQRFSIIILAVLAGMCGGLYSTMAMAQARWGFGAGPSVNSLYSDPKKTSFGAGGGGYLTRRFNSHLGLTLLGNYGQLPFTSTRIITIGNQTATGKFTTNALRGDLLLDYEISSGSFRPYVGVGLGGVNYKVTGKTNTGASLSGKKSFNTFDFGPSLGFRLMLGSRSAIDLGGSFRLTTTDSLDNITTTKAKDAIITGMLGFTLFFGGNRGTDIIAEQAPVEENNLDAFQERIDQMEANTAEQPQQDMQEYVRLKSKMDELNQQINQKDGEINTLRTAVAEKDQNVNAMQTQLASAPVNSASFSRGYEEALSKFYGKRYTEAIDQFNGIVAQFPDHPRVSNCVYWIGESHFGAGNYREAVNAFSRVLNYPRSLKRDDALLMLGRSYAQMNQKTEAREAFNRLIAEYPNSEFVAKAQEWLNRM